MNGDSVKDLVAEVRCEFVIEYSRATWLQSHDLGKCVSALEPASNSVVNKVVIRGVFVNARTYLTNYRPCIPVYLGRSMVRQVQRILSGSSVMSVVTGRILNKTAQPVVK